MTSPDDLIGLVGEHDVEVPLSAQSGCAPRAPEERALDAEVVATRLPRQRYRIADRLTVEITLQRHTPPGGRSIWIATAILAEPMSAWRGPRQWSAMASELDVARRLARSRGMVGFDFGQMFNDLGRTIEQGAQSIARSGVINNVLRDVRNAFDSPAGQGIMQVASFIPGVGQAIQGVRAATTLADNVMNGDRRARANLAQVQAAAQRGHPTAQRAVQVVNQVLAGQRRIVASRAQTNPPRPRQAPSPPPRRRATPAEENAWREAERRWNAWRAERAQNGEDVSEPLIPPPPAAER
jgi:hypothetical protein